METALVKSENLGMVLPTGGSPSIFLNMDRFEFAKKVAAMLAASNMVPTHFQGTQGVGNCMIALNLSERLGVDVFALMQTSYVVHGRPGFEAKLLIALFAAQTKLFIPPLRWETKGDNPRDKSFACRAYAIDKETKEKLYGEWIDWEMVKAEGWDSKNGSKWLTIPGQMFRYRAASFFINAYEPGLKMGIMTVDELEDMAPLDVTPLSLRIEGGKDPDPNDNPYKIQESASPASDPAQAESSSPSEPSDKGKQETASSGPSQEVKRGPGRPKKEPLQPESEKESDKPDPAQAAFLHEAENYKLAMPDDIWAKLLKAFNVSDPKEIKPVRYQTFLVTAKSQLDKALGGK